MFEKAKLYLTIATIGISSIVAITFIILWKNAKADLEKANTDLTIAQGAVTTLQKSVDEYKRDADLKSKLNFDLGVKLSTLQDSYDTDLKDMNTKLDILMTKRATAVVTINAKQYIKEDYLSEVSQSVLDTMWANFCKSNTTCQENVPK